MPSEASAKTDAIVKFCDVLKGYLTYFIYLLHVVIKYSLDCNIIESD